MRVEFDVQFLPELNSAMHPPSFMPKERIPSRNDPVKNTVSKQVLVGKGRGFHV